MKRHALIAAMAVVGAGAAYQGSVNLQASTPGSPQNGHSNISGTAKAGFFQGNGSLLTNLNATALSTGIITLTGTSPTYIIRGTNNSADANASGLIGITTAATGINYGGWFESKSDQGRALFGYASSTSGATYGTYAQNNSNAGRACYGIATSLTGNTYGGFFTTNSVAGFGVLGQASAASGTTYGVLGRATSPSGYGVYSDGRMYSTGRITAGSGFWGDGSNVYNVDAETLDGLTYTDFYRYGNSVAVNGNFSRPIDGVTSSTSGRGVNGHATATTGTTTGAYGTSDSAGGRGMVALATATNGSNRGIVAQANGDSGVAVEAKATSTTGSNYGILTSANGNSAFAIHATANSTTGTTYGVVAYSKSTTSQSVLGHTLSTTGANYGVQGGTNSAAGWGVFSYGRFSATGTKAFRIDHPFDPTNKYLMHYCSESPSPQNFYSGNAKTDAKGYAWVELPEYFEEINKNFKYQLTIVDDGDSSGFTMAKVSQSIRGNRFQIRTSEPNTTVSWRVEADRNDLYVRNRPTSDIEIKVGREKGTYQHPEFYGLPEERGVLYNQMHGPKGPANPAANKR